MDGFYEKVKFPLTFATEKNTIPFPLKEANPHLKCHYPEETLAFAS